MGYFDNLVQQGPSGGGGGGDQGGGGGYYGGGGGGSQYSPQFNWQNFLNMRQYISDRNQAFGVQQAPDYFAGYQGGPNTWQNYIDSYNQQYQPQEEERHRFSMDGGTESIFNNKYRQANAADAMAIEALKAGEFLNNLPGQIAGALGGEQAKQDWTFNPENFNLFDGIDSKDAAEVGKFALSLPGMIPGGIFEGIGKGYEAVTGAPIQENRRTETGTYEIADYTLDESQRVAAGVDSLIDVGGTFLGGSGKVVSTVGKGLAKAAGKNVAKGIEAAAEGTAKSQAQAAKYLSKSERLADRAEKLNEAADRMGQGLFDKAGFG